MSDQLILSLCYLHMCFNIHFLWHVIFFLNNQKNIIRSILRLLIVDLFPCAVELQWLDHLWNYENMFETVVVRANEC